MRYFWFGVAAGCAFLVVELVARLLASVPTIPELLQDRLVLATPGPLFSFVLDRLLYLGKPLLFTGLLLLQLVLAGLGGLAVARWRQPFLLAAVLWAITGVILLPIAGQGVFANRPSVAMVTLLAFVAYAGALVFYTGGFSAISHPRSTNQAEGTVATIGPRPDLGRRFLVGGGVTFLASAVLGRWIIGTLPSLPSSAASASSTSSPIPSASPGPGVSPDPALPPAITPTENFYVVSKNLVDPVVDAKSWHLTVEGLVDHPLSLTYQDVLAYPSVETVRTLECISNEVGGDLLSTGRFTGLRLADLLQKAGVQGGASVVQFTCADDYTETMPLTKALDPATLLVYRLNDQPLPPKHGFPLRVLGTGTYGMKNPKWLTKIQVAKSAPPGFWVEQGWNPDAIVQTMSEIYSPKAGTTIHLGEVTIGGVAFAGARGIRQVEVLTDGGTTWQTAKLLPPLGQYTWVLWEYAWHPAQPGRYTLVVRATDGTGVVQPNRDTDTFPDGATGYHRVDVQVSA